MRKVLMCVVCAVLARSATLPMLAADNAKETDRVENAGKVMTEILHVPDNIPQDLLDKAECVIVLPSVLKAAFIVGGSYGRGVMTCRGGFPEAYCYQKRREPEDESGRYHGRVESVDAAWTRRRRNALRDQMVGVP